ncbi:YqjK family protein [Hydrogenophaga sp.]|uniref:YqjK family protein n=1 Tax=Hydrogenophaga sp. TaxID=1904254 RepID=UPI003D11832C
MNPREAELAGRRERLVRRSGQLRRQVVRELQDLQPVLSWADRLYDAWLWLRAHPLVAVAGGVGLAASRPRRWLGLGLRAWSLWQLVQRLRAAGSTVSRRSH